MWFSVKGCQLLHYEKSLNLVFYQHNTILLMLLLFLFFFPCRALNHLWGEDTKILRHSMSCLFPSTHTDSYQGYPQRNSTIVREIYILWPLSFSIHTRLTILVMIVAVSATFIEQRRRALKRFLLLVVRHPILARDDITKIFLSAGGQVSKNITNHPLWPFIVWLYCRVKNFCRKNFAKSASFALLKYPIFNAIINRELFF